jgi:hypothetical protein
MLALEQLYRMRCRETLLAAISVERILADSTCAISAPKASAKFFFQQADSTGPSDFSDVLGTTPMQVQPLRHFVSKARRSAVHNVNVDHEQAAHTHGEVIHESNFGPVPARRSARFLVTRFRFLFGTPPCRGTAAPLQPLKSVRTV